MKLAKKIASSVTRRELQIIKCVADGMSNKAIGQKLHISPRTVDTHRTNIMRKLRVHNAAMLVKYAYESGLLTPSR